MGIARTLLSAGMAVVTLTAAAEQVTLKATNGQVISRSLGKPAKHLVINGTISVAQFSDSEGWPTKVSVGYDSDVKQVQEILTQAAVSQARVLASPAPAAHLSEFGADGLEFTLVFWIRDPSNAQAVVRSDINIAVLQALRQGGIEIPYPQRVLHVTQAATLPPAAG